MHLVKNTRETFMCPTLFDDYLYVLTKVLQFNAIQHKFSMIFSVFQIPEISMDKLLINIIYHINV